MKKWYEVIQCDNCELIQVATVKHYEDDAWPIYVHECENCGHIIQESEWDKVEGEQATKAIKAYISALNFQVDELTNTIIRLNTMLAKELPNDRPTCQ